MLFAIAEDEAFSNNNKWNATGQRDTQHRLTGLMPRPHLRESREPCTLVSRPQSALLCALLAEGNLRLFVPDFTKSIPPYCKPTQLAYPLVHPESLVILSLDSRTVVEKLFEKRAVALYFHPIPSHRIAIGEICASRSEDGGGFEALTRKINI
jgi:hypothetical protein